jgi:hypothetical protein
VKHEARPMEGEGVTPLARPGKAYDGPPRGEEVNQRGTRPGGQAGQRAVLPAHAPGVQAEADAALHDESSPARRGDPAR